MNTPKLKRLQLTNCVELAGIAIASQLVQELDFQMFVSLVHLELRCPRLERLQLQGCTRLGLTDVDDNANALARHIAEMGTVMASHIEAFLHATDTAMVATALPPFMNPLSFAAPVFDHDAFQQPQHAEPELRTPNSESDVDFAPSSWSPTPQELADPIPAMDIVAQLRRDCPILLLTPAQVFNCPLSSVLSL